MIHVIYGQKEWKQALETFVTYDFYHTYDYHLISKNTDEEPFLVWYEENDKTIAIPFLKRAIENSDYFDLTSVYGYAGPLSKNVDESFNNTSFIKELTALFLDLKIVSVFSRLHPYLKNQRIILKDFGETPVLGQVVNIDLTLPLDVQRTQYGKSTKNRTNKCRKLCNIIMAETDDHINSFIDVYYENMNRLSASKDYFFPRKYFFDFLKCSDFETDIMLIELKETHEIVAASMFVKTKNIVQFHLSGTRTSALNIAPANLFLDEMRMRATQEGYDFFNLGGGLGGQQDSLFNFKASFSKNHLDFSVWKYIVNPEQYEILTEAKKQKASSGFFPAYRA